MGDSVGAWTMGNDSRGDTSAGGLEKMEKLLKVTTREEVAWKLEMLTLWSLCDRELVAKARVKGRLGISKYIHATVAIM